MSKELYSMRFEKEQLDELRQFANVTGRSVSEYIRWLVDTAAPNRTMVYSGAVVLGVKIVTTSGEVWTGRGF